MHAWKCHRQIDRCTISELQEAALGAREPVAGPGIFLEETTDGR